jgi:hypothetical protein
MNGRLEWPDPTPDGPTPEEERETDLAGECQTCDGTGRIEVFYCKGVCECGMCPELADCPECCGHEPPSEPDIPALREPT